MPDYRYLIVGGGMTADAACRGIRDRDADGSIGLVGEEPDPPYSRPPLSKALWQGKDESSVWRGTSEFGVDLHLGRRVVSLDLAARRATDDQGETYGYERLLLATGGRPRRLPGDTGDDIVYFRKLPDYRRLRALAGDGASFVVIGGGFIGSEVAAALNAAGCKVTLVVPEAGIGARLFPADLAESVNELYRGHGVEVLPGELVSGVERGSDGYSVRLESGRTLAADAVVAGLGIEPATELAEAAGLEVSDGIVVDEYGRAGSSGDVYAAGDVARFPSTVLGMDTRVEHEDHANSHGRAVGANMAGADEPYTPPSLLLLRPVRARLRGCRRGRLAARDAGRMDDSAAKRRCRLPGRGRPSARVPSCRHVGEGRRRDRPDLRRRAAHTRAARRAARLRRESERGRRAVVPEGTSRFGRESEMGLAKRFAPFAALGGCALAVVIGASGSTSKATVSTAKNAALGTIVVGSTGRTLYHYLDDHGKKIDCTGACATQWPPVLVAKSAKPVAGAGIKAGKLGTITRPDGTVQVTYNGFPLYRFAGDTKSGQVNGQGLESSWYVLAPSGAVVKLNTAPAAGGSSSGAGSSSSSSGGTSGSTGTSSGGASGGSYSDY